MSEYGPGLSLEQVAEMDKERLKNAVRGFLVIGTDDEGEFIYDHATPEECEEYILDVFDHWYYMTKQGMDVGRALERVLENHGIKTEEYFFEFAAEYEHAHKEYNNYVYEFMKRELQEEAEDALE